MGLLSQFYVDTLYYRSLAHNCLFALVILAVYCQNLNNQQSDQNIRLLYVYFHQISLYMYNMMCEQVKSFGMMTVEKWDSKTLWTLLIKQLPGSIKRVDLPALIPPVSGIWDSIYVWIDKRSAYLFPVPNTPLSWLCRFPYVWVLGTQTESTCLDWKL